MIFILPSKLYHRSLQYSSHKTAHEIKVLSFYVILFSTWFFRNWPRNTPVVVSLISPHFYTVKIILILHLFIFWEKVKFELIPPIKNNAVNISKSAMLTYFCCKCNLQHFQIYYHKVSIDLIFIWRRQHFVDLFFAFPSKAYTNTYKMINSTITYTFFFYINKLIKHWSYIETLCITFLNTFISKQTCFAQLT